ncbi:MAG: HD domain-containing phosphohydrolase, partial [Candidatus Gastranaerophilaceae bacterium]
MADENLGASLFGRSVDLVDGDPLEEIFALNLGDFISENLISEDLAKKIGNSEKNKTAKLKNQLNELISVYSINKTLSVIGFSSKDDYIIYNSIAKTMAQILEIDACHVYLKKDFACGLENTDKDLVFAGSSLEIKDSIYSKNIGYNLDENHPVIECYANIKTVHSTNLENGFKELKEKSVKQFSAIPMHNNANVVGVFVLESYKDKTYRAEFVDLVEKMSRLFGTSVSLQKTINDTNMLIDDVDADITDLRHMRAELTALIGDLGDNQKAFVESLATAVDIKGQYSVSHSRNTAEMAKRISAEMGLNEKTKDLIYYAGLLQNIGKITLPEELFATKGKLSKEDWEKLKNYSNVGVNLLMNINFMSEVVPYICYQKERY